MNETIIMGMIAPYLKSNKLTYHEFEQIFRMLSLKEQYAVLEILNNNQIELVPHHNDQEVNNTPDSSQEEESFDILYGADVFSDDNQFEEDKNTDQNDDYLIIRKNVHISNRTLIRLIQEGDEQAKQDLCIKNHGLVAKCASLYYRYLGNKLDYDDLEQAGMLGMIKAAEKFDLMKGTEFSTYAVWWIKQSIRREIQDTGYSIRIPVHRMDQIQKVMTLDSKFAYENDYYNRLKLISDASDIPVALVEDCIRLYYQFIRTPSLDTPIGEDEEMTIGEIIPYEGELTVEEAVAEQVLKENMEEVLSTLTEREQKILRLRYGIDDGRNRTLEEVGHDFNVSRERIRQIEAKALRKLRHPSRSRKLKDFLN